MSRTVRVAALQLPPAQGQSFREIRGSNIANALAYIREAGRRGTDIACLPEMFASYGLPLGMPSEGCCDTVPGEVLDQIAQAARRNRMYVIAPLAATVDGVLRNTAVILDRSGALMGQYFKTHLTQPELDAGFVPGDDLPVFQLDFGRIGIMTCLDSMFPEVARVLAVRGAEIIFFPHVQSGYGEVGWVAQLMSRAIDNALHIVPVSFGVGESESWMPGQIMGRSGVVGPDGIWLASGGRQAAVVTTAVDLDRPRRVRCYGVIGEADFREQTFARRRPELYTALVEQQR